MIPLLLKSLVLMLGVKISIGQNVRSFSYGVARCIMDPYIQTTMRDVHFYLYTRNNVGVPEELVLISESKPTLQSLLLDSNDANQCRARSIATQEENSWVSKDNGQSSNHFQHVHLSKSSIKSRWFNTLAETKLIIHGYTQSAGEETLLAMKEEYLKKDNFNVILLDWSAKSMHPCYPKVVRSVEEVGKMVALFLDELVKGDASMEKIHLVGFSLGAHLAGFAGSHVKNGKLRRITGLDAASPFIARQPHRRLDKGDALLVDLIHTTDLLGLVKAMGHVDFYPNGGKIQPGCDRSIFSSCSHGRAVLFFTESINSPIGFAALPCSSWKHLKHGHCHQTGTVTTSLKMGDPCPLNATGLYFLTTNDKPPFAQSAKNYEDFKVFFKSRKSGFFG